MDTRLASKGNVRFRFHTTGSIANPYWPTATELNAGQELEGVTLWDNFEVGAQSSDTSDTPVIKAKTAQARRGAANFGGSASFLYPGNALDMVNLASLVYDIMKDVHVPGYLSVSIDGEIGEASQPSSDFEYAAGDLASIYRIMTDEWDDSITGEEAFFYTRNFLRNGMLAPYTVVSASTPVLAITGTAGGAAGGQGFLGATVNGREYKRGVRWSSSAPEFATVSASGVVDRVADGTATITATLPNISGVTDTESVVVS